jgi:hypothetical protein
VWLARWSNSTVPQHWDGPWLVGTGFSDAPTTLRPFGPSIRERGIATAYLYQDGPVGPNLGIFYRKVSNGVSQLEGHYCNTDGNTPMSCPVFPTPIGSVNDNVFMGSVRNAALPHSPFSINKWVVSYWTDEGQGNSGNIILKYAKFDAAGNFTYFSTSAIQKPCPTNANYWGDYDTMYVRGNGTSSAVFERPVTDSTSAACVPHYYHANPMHVTLLSIPVPQ